MRTHQACFMLTLLATTFSTQASGLEWGTYLGNSGFDGPIAMTADEAGVVTFVGYAEAGFPVTANAWDAVGDPPNDGFVARLDPDRCGPDQLVWSTFLGGEAGADWIIDVALADGDAVIVVGQTFSSDFPTTAGVYDETYGGGGDGFVARFDPSLSGPDQLVWSTLLGTAAHDRIVAVEITSSGDIVVAGYTQSAAFPVTPGAHDETFNGVRDIFVSRLSADGTTVVWSTYLGGSNAEGLSPPQPMNPLNADLMDIELDETTGDIYLCGYTESIDFPTTPDAWQTTYGGGSADGFASRLSADGSSLEWSTFIGGPGGDTSIAIDVDALGRVTIGANTVGSFPTTPGAVDPVCGTSSANDGVIVRLDPEVAGAAQVLCATCLGGSDDDYIVALHADDSAIVTVVGKAGEGFPVTPGAFDTSTYNGQYDPMVVRLDMNTCGDMIYGSYVGGSDVDVAIGVAVHGPDDVLIVNATLSDNHPVTPACTYDATFNGNFDAAALRLDLCPIDLDDSGDVGVTDFLEMLASWGPCVDCDDCPADFDGDCEVGVTDFLVLLANWGPCL